MANMDEDMPVLLKKYVREQIKEQLTRAYTKCVSVCATPKRATNERLWARSQQMILV